jgi:alkaline phosphatase D
LADILRSGPLHDDFTEPVEVAWQVAADEAMTRVVRSGTTVASPDWGHSVHVEVDGLGAGREYWYQFRSGGEVR